MSIILVHTMELYFVTLTNMIAVEVAMDTVLGSGSFPMEAMC